MNYVFSQESIRISGILTDLNNNPIHNSEVRFKGGMRAVENGKFSVSINSTLDTVYFTAYGYHTVKRVFTKATDELIVKLTPLQHQIEEVQIYTGYQVLKPNEINGSISTITNEMIQSRSTGNILDRIIGQSTGIVQSIGKEESKTGITVRGLGTINGPVDPLIVLDGFIYDGHLDNINPLDVDNITILKDAAASSIWGARAGNGVVVITTKKGRLNQGLTFNLNLNTNFGNKPQVLPQSRLGAKEYVELETFLFEKGFFDAQIRRNPPTPLTPVVETLLLERNGEINNLEVQQILEAFSKNDLIEEASKVLYRNPLNKQMNASIQGGGNMNTYAVSLGYQEDLRQNFANSSRINLRSQNHFKITNKLTWDLISQYALIDNGSGRQDVGSILHSGRFAEYLTLFDTNGEPTAYPSSYKPEFLKSIANGQLLDWNRYPATDHNMIDDRSKMNELQFITSLNYKIIKDLDFSISYQYQIQKNDQITIHDEESFKSRDLINRFSQYDPQTDVVKFIVPKGGIRESRYDQVKSQTFRSQLNYFRTFNKHSLRLMGGAEARESETNGGFNATQYGFNSDPLSYTNIDVIGLFPHVVTGNMSRVGATTSTLSNLNNRFVSFYGNGAYIYQGKYIVSGSIRRDGSNIFGVATNDKWKPLWSAGLGWNLSDEKFYYFEHIPKLRLTVTYGHSGNVDVSRSGAPVASYGVEAETRFPFARISAANNPDLRWETLKQLSVTLNGETTNNRINFSISYFNKNGTDLYGLEPYDYTGWGRSPTIIRNAANMNGQGLEIGVISKNFVSRNFNWTTNTYFNWKSDKTTKYYNDNSYVIGYQSLSTGAKINPVVGLPLYSVSVQRFGGLDENGDPLVYLNGELTKDYLKYSSESMFDESSYEYFGSATPTYFGAIVNQMEYKRFALNFNVSFRLGYYQVASTINYMAFVSTGKGHNDYNLRWQKPGDEKFTNVPRFEYPYNSRRETIYPMSSANVYLASHAHLDYINLLYRINTTQWKKPLRELEIQGGIENVGILWKSNNKGIHPDYPSSLQPSVYYKFSIRSTF